MLIIHVGVNDEKDKGQGLGWWEAVKLCLSLLVKGVGLFQSSVFLWVTVSLTFIMGLLRDMQRI